MPLQLATTDTEIARCFETMRELRPHLQSAEEFVVRVKRQQEQGFKLAYLEDANRVTTVAGFRVQDLLATGLTMYVDDLVTAEAARSRGFGTTMLDALIAHAREFGCEMFSLDSGTHRREAHAFYFRERMRISSFHFVLSLK